MAERDLEHHVFTSWDGFETVARSGGLTEDEVRTLVDRAGPFPQSPDGSSWTADPPTVFRGFRLASGGAAVAQLLYLGGDRSGRLGNYLAHSVVFRAADLETTGADLAWLAARLTFARRYEKRALHGPDAVPPLRAQIEPDGAFALFPSLVAEQGPERVGALLSEVVRHIGGARPVERPLVLALGATPPGRPPLLPGAAAARVHPDVWSLMRVAALLAVLPRAFQLDASFSLNETRAESARGRFALTLLRGGREGSAGGPLHPYAALCLALAETRPDALRRLQAWVSTLLTGPSEAALAVAAPFFRDVVLPLDDGVPPTGERFLAALAPLAEVDAVVTETLAAEALRLFAAGTLSPEVREPLLADVCGLLALRRVDDTAGPAFERLLGALLARFVAEAPGDPDAACRRFATLPVGTRRALWRLARRERGWPFEPTAPPPAEGELTLAVSAALGLGPHVLNETPEVFEGRIHRALRCVASQTVRILPGELPGDRKLRLLLSLPAEDDPGVMARLLRSLAPRLAPQGADDPRVRAFVLVDILTGALGAARRAESDDRAFRVATFALAYDAYDPDFVPRLAMRVAEDGAGAASLALVRAIAQAIGPTERLRLEPLVLALRELGGFVQGQVASARDVRRIADLPGYELWARQQARPRPRVPRAPAGSGSRPFLELVEREVGRTTLPVADAVALGASYLAYTPDFGLLGGTLARLAAPSEAASLASWLADRAVPSPCAARCGPGVRVVATLLEAAERLGVGARAVLNVATILRDGEAGGALRGGERGGILQRIAACASRRVSGALDDEVRRIRRAEALRKGER